MDLTDEPRRAATPEEIDGTATEGQPRAQPRTTAHDGSNGPPRPELPTAPVDDARKIATLDELAGARASKPRDDAKAPEQTNPSSAPTEPQWSMPLTTPSARQSANGLTAVNAPTPTESAEGDLLRARMRQAQVSATHQRAMRDVAHGEVVLPDLGRVSVSARSERDAVAIEVRASQASTAQSLYAHAPSIASEVRAADIAVNSVSFEGVGTWSPSSERDAPREGSRNAERAPAEDDAPAVSASSVARARVSGRVRIVL